MIPSRSASSAISATPTTRKSQPEDPPSTSYEVGHEDEPEYLTPNANQTAQLLPPNSERGTALWILASRELHAPKKAVDVQFIARMADLRQQTNGTSSTSSTPQTRESMALLGSPVSLASSAFSQSFSITSPPPAVEFPPTPVFADQIPEGFMRSVAQTPVISALRKPHPLQNSHPAAIQSLDTIHEVATSSSSNSTPRQQPIKLPVSTSSIRRGYWNRRGDHLTPEGYLVFPPKSMQYPDDLRIYPFENEGYRDHSGLFTAYVKRPELPQSLRKRGNPPERPYESVSFFFFEVEEWFLNLAHPHSSLWSTYKSFSQAFNTIYHCVGITGHCCLSLCTSFWRWSDIFLNLVISRVEIVSYFEMFYLKPLQFGWTVFSQQVGALCQVWYISFYTTIVFDTRWTQISSLQICKVGSPAALRI